MRVKIVDSMVEVLHGSDAEHAKIKKQQQQQQKPTANNGTEHIEIYLYLYKHISNKIAARTNGDKLNLSTRSEANKISIHKL